MLLERAFRRPLPMSAISRLIALAFTDHDRSVNLHESIVLRIAPRPLSAWAGPRIPRARRRIDGVFHTRKKPGSVFFHPPILVPVLPAANLGQLPFHVDYRLRLCAAYPI